VVGEREREEGEIDRGGREREWWKGRWREEGGERESSIERGASDKEREGGRERAVCEKERERERGVC
jgi:hypothetical protein